MPESSDRPLFSYVIRLGVSEDAPQVDLDHSEDLAVGRFATVTLRGRLVIPFADECELVLAPGSEVAGLVIEKFTPAEEVAGDEDPNEAAFRVVRDVTRQV